MAATLCPVTVTELEKIRLNATLELQLLNADNSTATLLCGMLGNYGITCWRSLIPIHRPGEVQALFYRHI